MAINRLGKLVQKRRFINRAILLAPYQKTNIHLLIAGLLTLLALQTPFIVAQSHKPPTEHRFEIQGLTSPATVAGSIFVQCPALPHDSIVTYSLDNRPIATTSTYPFWIGGIAKPTGYSLQPTQVGRHLLTATATQPSRTRWNSYSISLNVIPSINSKLSSGLHPYLNQVSAQNSTQAYLLSQLDTPAAQLTPEDRLVRNKVTAMYRNWGMDPALDNSTDQSAELKRLLPTGWAAAAITPHSTAASMHFSPDAPFYQPIPAEWPRVELPKGYIRHLQLNTASQGDGIGFGEVTASASDSYKPIRSQWYDVPDTLHVYPFKVPADWSSHLPTQPKGDRHMIFIDPATNQFLSTYMTSVDPVTHGARALYAAPPQSFNSLGDSGGSIAANFAELPTLLQPGEASDPTHPIPHALGGPVARVWAARVYPATARDADVLTSKNSCTHVGYTNTGLVPYGGVIQLDPQLNLAHLQLSLPARRILQAIQTYGYYVMDFGCTDMDIYTAISASELDPFGGLWGNSKGPGVQNEVERVLTTQKLYVVAPLNKKE